MAKVVPRRTKGDPRLRLSYARHTDWPRIARLLQRVDLPLAGASRCLNDFLVCRADDEIVGVGGLEIYGSVALLRSVAVEPKYQSHGIGGELVRALLECARVIGVDQVALLTTSASAYFERFGFVGVNRADLPSVLSASEELKGACPESAVALIRELRHPSAGDPAP